MDIPIYKDPVPFKQTSHRWWKKWWNGSKRLDDLISQHHFSEGEKHESLEPLQMVMFQLDVPNQIFTFEMVHQKLFPCIKKMPCFRFQGASISNFPSIDKTSLRHSQNQTTPVIQKSCYVSNTGNDTGQQQEKARIIGMPLLCQLGRGRTRGFFFRPPKKKKNLVATWWFGGNEFLSCAKFEKHGGDVTKNRINLSKFDPTFCVAGSLNNHFSMLWFEIIQLRQPTGQALNTGCLEF